MATNFLKLTREQLAIITGGDPRAIKAFEDFISAVNNLGAHALTHQPGGSDPLAVDALPAVGSLRTLGTGAQKAAAGIHAGTHVTGGGDTIANAIAGGNAGLLSGADKAKLDGLSVYFDTAANLAALNPVMAAGQLGWESDTLSGKIGDGATAYNTLTYFYRGLPVSGEPSLGTWKDIASPASGWQVSAYGLGATTWYTVTSTGQPSVARKIKVFIYASGGFLGGYLYYRPYGSALAAIQARGLLVWGGGAQCEVPVDSSGRWDVYSSAAVTLYVAYPVSYCC